MNTKSLFKGSCVALITPFKDKKIDYEKLKNLLEFQIKEGTNAILVLGTTGEPATMTAAEKEKVTEFSAEVINKRVPLLVGTGCNNTEAVISASKKAQQLGADGLLIVTPYYNKCTQGGLAAHYLKIADSVNLPIIVYNVPSRTGVNVLPKTLNKIGAHDNIYGIKESSGNIEQMSDMIEVCANNNMEFYSGDDGVAFPTIIMGGAGVISVTANIIPRFMSRLAKYCLDGEIEKARQMHFKLMPLVKAVFSEVNPIPVKAAASMMGLCGGQLRLPLTEIEPQNRETLSAALKNFGLI
ncbi:MAG: 4-hydroxy-tetrahydrodipicolinate synthase [Clostridia bacterium]|nr:4-hydroxy-tetrahydrodipicolinate synthase [Clostridia bacterium]